MTAPRRLALSHALAMASPFTAQKMRAHPDSAAAYLQLAGGSTVEEIGSGAMISIVKQGLFTDDVPIYDPVGFDRPAGAASRSLKVGAKAVGRFAAAGDYAPGYGVPPTWSGGCQATAAASRQVPAGTGVSAFVEAAPLLGSGGPYMRETYGSDWREPRRFGCRDARSLATPERAFPKLAPQRRGLTPSAPPPTIGPYEPPQYRTVAHLP